MSYSSDVKTELASLNNLDCCNRAELSALFHIGGSLELSSEGHMLVYQTTNNAVIRKVVKLLKDRYSVETALLSKKTTKFQKHDLFLLSISDQIDKILEDLSLYDNIHLPFTYTNPEIFYKDCCKKSYLRGCFLSGGSINSPETSSYHLEIQTFSLEQAEVIQSISKEYLLSFKIAKNKRGFIAYLKEAEKIADFLKVVGATNSLFEFEDSRIKRDFKNSINRVINCDIANEKKALDAAKKQLEYIEIVENKMKDQISKSMKEAIFLRKTYPEATLSELSELSIQHFDEDISKSALNHRFRALKDLASQIMIEGDAK